MGNPDRPLNLDTGEQAVLIPNGSNPHYARTGHIVYGLDGALWAVGFDRERLAVTTSPALVVENVNTKISGAANFSLSADGAIVYVPGTVRDPRDEGRQFVWLDRAGNGETTAVEARGYQEFSLSPDGAQVATTVENDVWVYDLASGTPTPLTFDPGARKFFPTWTPDGSRVVFGETGPERDQVISWKAADGSGAIEPLVEGDEERWSPQAFSPDGSVLVFEEGVETGLGNLGCRARQSLGKGNLVMSG